MTDLTGKKRLDQIERAGMTRKRFLAGGASLTVATGMAGPAMPWASASCSRARSQSASHSNEQDARQARSFAPMAARAAALYHPVGGSSPHPASHACLYSQKIGRLVRSVT